VGNEGFGGTRSMKTIKFVTYKCIASNLQMTNDNTKDTAINGSDDKLRTQCKKILYKTHCSSFHKCMLEIKSLIVHNLHTAKYAKLLHHTPKDSLKNSAKQCKTIMSTKI
jgi:hypothetical protein